MPSTGQFYQNEQLTSADLQNAVDLLMGSFTNLIVRTIYPNVFVILSGLATSQSATADNGVQVSAGLAYKNGQTVLVSTQQGVNILPGSYPNGTGLAADATYSRIDVVYIEYTQSQANQQTRTFAPPNETPYTQTVYTETVDGYTLSVVHGVASSSPVVPSIPSGAVALAQVLVPTSATTITTSDITDETASYRNDGGRLALASANLLSFLSSTELGTPTGMKLNIGSTAYLKDNTTSGRLDIYGGTSGTSAHGVWKLTHSGTPLTIQPTTDATAGTHVASWRNASGTEYAWIDNNGYLSVSMLELPNLTSFPTIGASGSLIVVNSMPYVSNGTSWVDPMIDLMQLSTSHGGTADFYGTTTLHGGVGLTVNQLPAPTGLTATNATSGTVGSYIAASTAYTYSITAVSYANTETSASTSASVTTGATAYPINLAWTNGGADVQFYNIYKNGLFLAQIAGTVSSYQDAGNTATTSQTPPATNQTGIIQAGNGITGTGTTGTLTAGTGILGTANTWTGAQSFGALNVSGTTNVLRTDSGAPNPQTVANPVSLNGGITNVVELSSGLTLNNPTAQPTDATDVQLFRNASASNAVDLVAPEFRLVPNSATSYPSPVLTFSGGGDITTVGTVTAFSGGLPNGSNGLAAGVIPSGAVATIIANAEFGYGNWLEQLMVDGSLQWHVDASGNAQAAGTVTAASGQLGSSSGEWTPAAGTFNVAAGTVINVASVPSGAVMFYVGNMYGGNATTITNMWGITDASGSHWQSNAYNSGGGGSVGSGFSNGISGTAGAANSVTLSDSTYVATGYYQINAGYLQFVVLSSATTSTGSDNFRWGVS